MKQFLKLASLLVIGALVVLPALASLPCASGAVVACVPGCPMAMNDMGPDCPMSSMASSQLSATDCPLNCCNPALTQVIARPPAAPKLSLVGFAPSPVAPIAAVEPGLALAATSHISPAIASPPRYILIRVFRI